MAGNSRSGRRPAERLHDAVDRRREEAARKFPAMTEPPAPPANIGAHGSRAYRSLARQLVDARVLSRANLPLLEVYAVVYQRWHDCRASIKSLGVVLATGRKNPAVSAAATAETELLRIMTEFGLTPGSMLKAAPLPFEEDNGADDEEGEANEAQKKSDDAFLFGSGPRLVPASGE